MTALEILKAARARIAKRADWSKSWWEIYEGGHHRVCALGAIKLVSGLPVACGSHLLKDETLVAAQMLAEVVSDTDDPSQIMSYNDTHDHSCVIEAFDTAIEKLKPTVHPDQLTI